jgi:hypothetical protein
MKRKITKLLNVGSRRVQSVQQLGYRLDDRRIGERFPAVEDFSLLRSVQTRSCTHPASYTFGTGDILPGREVTRA